MGVNNLNGSWQIRWKCARSWATAVKAGFACQGPPYRRASAAHLQGAWKCKPMCGACDAATAVSGGVPWSSMRSELRTRHRKMDIHFRKARRGGAVAPRAEQRWRHSMRPVRATEYSQRPSVYIRGRCPKLENLRRASPRPVPSRSDFFVNAACDLKLAGWQRMGGVFVSD